MEAFFERISFIKHRSTLSSYFEYEILSVMKVILSKCGMCVFHTLSVLANNNCASELQDDEV